MTVSAEQDPRDDGARGTEEAHVDRYDDNGEEEQGRDDQDA